MDFKKLKITGAKYWNVFLHEDQTAIGRMYFWYKDDKTLDLLDAPEEAILEFYNLAKGLRTSLVTCFNSDMFNYLVLSNNTRHLHIHIIPRYSRKVEQFGIIFQDGNFGKSYKRNLDFKLDMALLLKIRELIKNQLELESLN